MTNTGASESTLNTGTLVDTEDPSKPSYQIRKITAPQVMGRGIGGAIHLPSAHVPPLSRSRGVPIAPMQLEGEKPVAKAFTSTPTKVIETSTCQKTYHALGQVSIVLSCMLRAFFSHNYYIGIWHHHKLYLS